jgi:MFS family permease
MTLALATLSSVVLLLVFVYLGRTIFGRSPVRDSLISRITPTAYEGRTFGYFWTIVLLVGSAYRVVIGYLADEIGTRASFSYLGIALLLGIGCIGLLYSPLDLPGANVGRLAVKHRRRVASAERWLE